MRILFLLLFIPITLTAQQNKIKRTQLTWDHFINDKPADLKYDASVYPGFKFGYKVKSVVKDKVILLPQIAVALDTSKSFFNKKMMYTATKLLKHEQGHVDITSIFAEKLKQIVAKNTFYTKNFKSEFIKLGKQYVALMMEEQQKYDLETKHGADKEMQAQWDKYFDEKIID